MQPEPEAPSTDDLQCVNGYLHRRHRAWLSAVATP
jgi:hypothetical protein